MIGIVNDISSYRELSACDFSMKQLAFILEDRLTILVRRLPFV